MTNEGGAMNTALKPFKVRYYDLEGKECEGVVYAYDVETARSRAVHEGMVDRLELIIEIVPVEKI